MNVPKVDIKQLLEAGVHLGHKTLRWNPKMKKYIFGEKNSIHIIDLTQTVEFIKNALVQVHKVISSGGKLLVVSTKKQASEQISELAKETGQYFVNYRWLGGMLTNWNTIQNSIKRLKKLEDQLSKENLGFTKKEILKFGKEREKLNRSLGGIVEMRKTPDLIFVIDTNVESLAVAEAKKLGIPIIAVLDTNSDPTGIDFPIPGNDDSTKSIRIIVDVVLDAIQSGASKRVQAPTKRKDITPVTQEPDFLENEDEPEVTLPEGYDEMDFDDRKKSEKPEEAKDADTVTESAEAPESDSKDEAAEEPAEPAKEEPVAEEATS